MNHKERMWTVLYDKKVPDKIPHGDITVNPNIHKQIFRNAIAEDEGNFLMRLMTDTYTERFFRRHLLMHEFLGLDFIVAYPREPLKNAGLTEEGYQIVDTLWGNRLVVSPKSTQEIVCPVPDLGSCRDYRFPSAGDFAYDNLECWIRNSDLCVMVQIDTGFFKVNQLTGLNEYMMNLDDHKADLEYLMEKLADQQVEIVRHSVSLGADCVLLANDFAFNSGPFISPELLWDLDFKYEKRIIDESHRLGKPCIMHACGNQQKTIDMLVEIGLDGLHALQPSAGNDIRSIKKRYGKRLVLIGNVDINELLPRGTPWEVDQVVKGLIRDVGCEGGFVLTTCNGILADTPLENAMAMHLGCEKYGHYPLQA